MMNEARTGEAWTGGHGREVWDREGQEGKALKRKMDRK